ncbi:FYVE zinc finger-domain-containing protein [Aspergillus avenaceus]|uniref:RING-type E3 ubiquitin transferase n=1 Tax=Aspergillus avenaceus TaxID=36643 RepID=A0A5N6TP38_ASPAV|nr:FYVE zinc finger-domain-containing protein [Aspergillus avenaceus]
MSSSSSSSSAPVPSTSAAPIVYPPPGLSAGFRPHASDNTMTSEAGPAFDRRSGRRRSTVTGSDRKRRLVNAEDDTWSRQSIPRSAIETGPHTPPDMDSRSILHPLSPTRPESSVAGTSYATPIDLSSSPPDQRAQRASDRRSSWARPGNDYLEYIRPRWQPDSEVTSCPICGTDFSFWYRKHHCRKCGRVVCASCSPHRITIPRQFIVHPPDASRPRASTLIPPRVTPMINLAESSPQSPTALNPALGGGEEVRLCNPCVPDPNPDPPRGFGTVRASGDPQSGADYSANQHRPRSYHSLSSPTRNPPYAAIPESFSSRSGRRTAGTNEHPFYGSFGGSFGSQPLEYGSLSAARFAPSIIATGRPLPMASGSAMSAGPSFSASVDHGRRLTAPSVRRHVDERDLCPICDQVLPPLGENRNEDAREAHIRQCIDSHGPRARSSPHPGSPVAQSSHPVRMLTFTATEKDCLGQDGSAQECTICMEDYEVGQSLVRLECLCKFHKQCIVEWFERKKECPVHKVS